MMWLAFLSLFGGTQHDHAAALAARTLEAAGGAGASVVEWVTEAQALATLTATGAMVAAKSFLPCGRLNKYGIAYGGHMLCESALESAARPPCTIFSYGINRDWTFDTAVQNRTGCRVFGLDPTQNHRSLLGSGIWFLHWAHPVPEGLRSATTDGWVQVGPALLAKSVAPGRQLAVLKIDCDGCEFATYNDTMAHDPHFFERVAQIEIEVHISRPVLQGRRELLACKHTAMIEPELHTHHTMPMLEHEPWPLTVPTMRARCSHDGRWTAARAPLPLGPAAAPLHLFLVLRHGAEGNDPRPARDRLHAARR